MEPRSPEATRHTHGSICQGSSRVPSLLPQKPISVSRSEEGFESGSGDTEEKEGDDEKGEEEAVGYF